MAYYPTSATGLAVTSYPVGPSTGPTTLTAAASANTKGSYATIVASSPVTTNTITLVAVNGTNSVSDKGQLIDLATGAAGSETVVVPNLATDWGVTNAVYGGTFTCQLPLAVSSGTRIAGRTQATTASLAVGVAVTVVAAGSFTGIGSFVNYGADTATSGQTQVDPGGTVNTKGSYTQITASTSAAVQSLLVMATWNAIGSGGLWAVDLATGAGGAEVVQLADLRFTARDNVGGTMTYAGRMQWFLTYLATSTRVAMRASCNQNDATHRLIEFGLIAGTA